MPRCRCRYPNQRHGDSGAHRRRRTVYLMEKEMKKYVSVAVVWAACAVPAFACDRPTAPTSIPDGNSASKEDMLAAKKSVDAFKSAVEEYVTCEKSAAKVDSISAELVKVADRFNEQVRAFKAKG